MKKIVKTIKGILALLKNPWLLNHVLNDDSIWRKYIAKNHKNQSELAVLNINSLNNGIDETLHSFAFLDGGSLPTDIALLKILSRRFEKCSYFEIGTWRGESVVNVSETAEECYTLNLPKEEILALGLSESYADLHGFFSKGKKNIRHLHGNSLHYDFEALNKKFDLIFIDGNHHYDYVKNDTKKVFEHLIHENSIVVWHDYAYSPEKIRPEVFAGILDGIPTKFKGNLYHVSNTMCAVFIRGKFDTTAFQSPIQPKHSFKVSIESQNC
ncbi:MAG: class I SAM-dependent methyltransferase [Flavobacteriales bacterium]|nr:class I SAM-dependent methyltransferase [Flavobacteriales bacterium]